MDNKKEITRRPMIKMELLKEIADLKLEFQVPQY